MRLFLELSGSPGEFSHDDFLQQVQTNIERGHFRLVIAIDEPPEPLLKTVEFVNRFSERFEIFLVQLKRFRDQAKKQNIFVPALFGKVATGRPPQRERWNETRFIEHLKRSGDLETVEYTLDVYDHFKEWTDEPYWGSGTTHGSFNLLLLTEGARVNLAGITSRGDLYVNFGTLASKGLDGLVPPLADRLTAVRGITLPADLANKYPPIPKAVLKDQARRKQVLEALSLTIQEIKSLHRD
jgi:hypothetical protein